MASLAEEAMRFTTPLLFPTPVTLITTSSLNDIYESKITEGLTMPCEDNGKGFFQLSNLKQILDKSEECDSVLIGPGLGNDHVTLSPETDRLTIFLGSGPGR